MNKKQLSKVEKQKLALRQSMWPELDESTLWHRHTTDGWLTIPRAMPLILRIMDMLAPKGKPVSPTYFDLWCRTYDDSFVIVTKQREMAFYSGFTGERAERTWADRMNLLKELGFIDIKPGTNGPIHYVLVFNPYPVIQRHHQEGRIGDAPFNALRERVLEIGASEFESADSSEKKDEAPATAGQGLSRRTANTRKSVRG